MRQCVFGVGIGLLALLGILLLLTPLISWMPQCVVFTLVLIGIVLTVLAGFIEILYTHTRSSFFTVILLLITVLTYLLVVLL